MFWFPLTWGAGSAVSAPDPGAHWAWRAQGRGHRTFTPRVRDEYWVETGHRETADPYTDTRDLP